MDPLAGLHLLFPAALVEDEQDEPATVRVVRLMRSKDPRRERLQSTPIVISKVLQASLMQKWSEDDRRGKGMGTLAEAGAWQRSWTHRFRAKTGL